MSITLTHSEIIEKIEFLYSRLPKRPTAVESLYEVAPLLESEILKSNYSQQSLQQLSDNMGFYLGLFKSIRVSFVDLAHLDKRFFATAGGEMISGWNDTDISGLYKVRGTIDKEILIIKKHKFEIVHVCAILAHEYTHNYLYHHDICLPKEKDNEILTDIAAVYLGLVFLLFAGYKQVEWTDSYNGKEYTFTLGYVSQETIRNALLLSAPYRRWDPDIVVKGFKNSLHRLSARMKLSAYKKEFRSEKKQLKREQVAAKQQQSIIEDLKQDIKLAESRYFAICKMTNALSEQGEFCKMNRRDGMEMADIHNKIFSQEHERQIKEIKQCIDNLAGGGRDREIEEVKCRVAELQNMLSRWEKLFKKYHVV